METITGNIPKALQAQITKRFEDLKKKYEPIISPKIADIEKTFSNIVIKTALTSTDKIDEVFNNTETALNKITSLVEDGVELQNMGFKPKKERKKRTPKEQDPDAPAHKVGDTTAAAPKAKTQI